MNSSFATSAFSNVPGLPLSPPPQVPLSSVRVSSPLPVTLTLYTSAIYTPQGGGVCVLADLSPTPMSTINSDYSEAPAHELSLGTLLPEHLHQQTITLPQKALKSSGIDSEDSVQLFAFRQAFNMAINVAELVSSRASPESAMVAKGRWQVRLTHVVVHSSSTAAVDLITYLLYDPTGRDTLVEGASKKQAKLVRNTRTRANRLLDCGVHLSINVSPSDSDYKAAALVRAQQLAEEKFVRAVERYHRKASASGRSAAGNDGDPSPEQKSSAVEAQKKMRRAKKLEKRASRKLQHLQNPELHAALLAKNQEKKEMKAARQEVRKKGIRPKKPSQRIQPRFQKISHPTGVGEAVEQQGRQRALWRTNGVIVGEDSADEEMNEDDDYDELVSEEGDGGISLGHDEAGCLAEVHGSKSTAGNVVYGGGIYVVDQAGMPEDLRGISKLAIEP